MFLNLLTVFGRTLLLAVIHTPGITKFISYKFKEDLHNGTEKYLRKLNKDLGVKETTPFKKYSDD